LDPVIPVFTAKRRYFKNVISWRNQKIRNLTKALATILEIELLTKPSMWSPFLREMNYQEHRVEENALDISKTASIGPSSYKNSDLRK
jgi:hypothetical protein